MRLLLCHTEAVGLLPSLGGPGEGERFTNLTNLKESLVILNRYTRL